MNWKGRDLDALLARDIDEVVDSARSLGGKERTAALRGAIGHLEAATGPLDRLKTLLFIQTLLASMADGKLASTVADLAAGELARVVLSASEGDELKRPALDGLALLFMKARELTTSADARVRAAFTAARNFADPRIRDFARGAFRPDGVLAQRVVQRRYRVISVSIKAAAAASFAAGAAVARKKYLAVKQKRTAATRNGRPESQRSA
jgi:hypothetical protein